MSYPKLFPKMYSVWTSMRYRCNNSNSNNYKYYGGKGVKICKRWDKFENFLHDMGEKPDGLSIDRIDGDGDYEPNNCRWATQQQQCENKRHLLKGKGKLSNAIYRAGYLKQKAFAKFLRDQGHKFMTDSRLSMICSGRLNPNDKEQKIINDALGEVI